MRIGILTHHYIKNYGAFLQVYALQETLKKEFPNDDVYVINYINRKHLFVNIAGWYRFNPKKDSIKKYFQKITIPSLFSKIEKEYLNTSKKVYNVRQVNELNFDAIIIGSDEVWHYGDKKSYDPIKFGLDLTCKNVITYAPSMGGANINEASNEVIEGLKNIKAFSARDNSAEEFVKKYTNKKCTRVLDPTLLYEFPEYSSKIVDRLKKERYLLMYYCDGLPDDLKKEILNYAQEHNLKIYGAGEYKKWFDDFPININPFEWIEMFRNAEVIFTGTFHGTIFSLKSQKQFFNYLSNPSRIKKVNSLLSEFKISDRIIKDKLESKENIDYTVINKIIEENRLRSVEYLEKSIK